jgi:hypothetical protein
MLALFEVHLAPGADISQLLSVEALRETEAQIMTVAEAKAVGFGNLETLEASMDVYLLAVSAKDSAFIGTRLESSPIVSRFQVHHVDG